MNICRLCQQLHNNLTIIYNNRLKSLTQIILKLKGFKDSWDLNDDLAVCETCIQGVENVASFWENIPEAKKGNADIPEELKEQNASSYKMEQNLPALTLEDEEENYYEPSAITEEKLEPIKLRIKLPRKRKKSELGNIKTTFVNIEPMQKRTRRCPQRYDDFQLTCTNNDVTWKEENSSFIKNSSACHDLTQVASLRLENSQTIGTLSEIKSKEYTCRIRIACLNCCQVFRSERIFQKHIETHPLIDLQQSQDNLTKYLYHCKLCDKPFSNHRAVRKHYNLAHSEERLFKCSHCEASFKYKFNLNYHVSTKHIPKKKFECSFCKKMFLMRYELKIHVRTHTKERPYKCELCTSAFAHKSNLKTHQKLKHLEKSADTTTLIKQFMPPEHLIEHEEVFLDEKDESTFFKESLEQETDLQSDSISFEQSLEEPKEQIKPEEAMMEQENISKYKLDYADIVDSTIPTNFERFENGLEKNYEATAAETIFGTEGSTHNAESEQPNLEDNKNYKISTANEISEEFHKAQPLLGVFQLDSSLLKVLPSTSLLGLKKWSKSFQSAPKNQLQLVKSSTFFTSHNIDEFEMNKILRDFKERSKKTPENSSNSINSYKTTSQLIDNNTPTNLPESVSDLNSFNLHLSAKSLQVTETKEDNLINITKQLLNHEEQINLKDFNTYKSWAKMPLEKNAPQAWENIKVSSRPIKVNYVANSNQSRQTDNKNFTTKEVSTNKSITNATANPNENLKPNILLTNNQLKHFKISPPNTTSESLLNPVTKPTEATSVSFTNSSLNQTLLHNKPLITNIEILPPLKTLNTVQKSPTTTTNLIKPPVEYKFQCPLCYKYFKQKSPLTKHLRTHTGEKPYKCDLCPKSYADASNYKKHTNLHKNAETLNTSRKTSAQALQSSPAYSMVSDPDPDGIEVLQTLKKFECTSSEDDIDSDSSNMETQMWHDALDQALYSEEIRANIRTIVGINNAVLPKSVQQATKPIDLKKTISTEDPD